MNCAGVNWVGRGCRGAWVHAKHWSGEAYAGGRAAQLGMSLMGARGKTEWGL